MKRYAKWKAAAGIILTTMLTLMVLTIIYWLFVVPQIEKSSNRVLVMVGMIYGGMYLHRLLIRRYTCWWNVWEEDEKEDEN